MRGEGGSVGKMGKGRLMRTVLLAYVLFAMSASAAAQSQNPQYQAFVGIGVGQSSCGKYIEAAAAEHKFKEPGDSPDSYRTSRYGSFVSFADGFITGSNYGDPDNREVGQNTDHSGRMAWLENYCRSNPLNAFAEALSALRKVLVSGR
jgi:hypothetical protein